MQPRIHQLIVILTGAWSVMLSPPARAQQPDNSSGVDAAPCFEKCHEKLGLLQCTTVDNLKACLQDQTIPECKGLNFSGTDAAMAADVCRVCSEMDMCVKKDAAAAAAANQKRKAPAKRLTEQQRCERGGTGYYVHEPELGPDGQPTGKILNYCFNMKVAYERYAELAKKVAALQQGGGGLSPADRALLDQLKELIHGRMLPPEFEEKLAALERLCPVIKEDPHATLSVRCEHTMKRLDLTEHAAHEASQKADAAHAEATLANERINGIHDRREAPDGKRPILLAGIFGTLHGTKSPIRELPRLGGLEATWMPHLIPDLSLTFRAGIGTGAGVPSGDGSLIGLLGVGLCGPIPWTDDVTLGGIISMEHWFRGDETSTFNFYGFGPEIFWFPGASKRTSQTIRHQEDLKVYGPQIEPVGWRAFGGAIGARAVFGGSFAGRPGTRVVSYWDQAYSITVSVGF